MGPTRTQRRKFTPAGLVGAVATGAAVELTRRGAGVVSDKIDDKMQEEFNKFSVATSNTVLQMFMRDFILGMLPLSGIVVDSTPTLRRLKGCSHRHRLRHMALLILMRHGQSMWNAANLFTGWVDVPLTNKGIEEAVNGGKEIASLPIDEVHVSTLIRAQMTAMLALAQHDSGKTPIFQ